ncbi:hypothetical protein [Fodinibius halophilus]|uniref:Aromatic hydrocarbon degradation protein n=1 Tax=Fodinibius halophilus TaxID=1736908 RepID=A0A6M1SVB9_9BACT|nr:hypothetical protein [Fodinibius halophilus]NGP87526.1 hypothetical protein [Fodinibius halophilus]
MRKLVLIAVVFCFTSSVSWAQSAIGSEASNGSIYSKLGVGYPVSIANTSSSSSGLLGVSFNESSVGNLANPAHWGSTVYGLGAGGLDITSYTASSNNAEVTNVEFGVKQFQLQLPIIRGKLGLSGSFAPLTNTSYQNFDLRQQIIDRGAAQDTLQYVIQNEGTGGVNSAELGLGWKINENISIGYAASAVFISHEDEYTSNFINSEYNTVSYTYKTNGVALGNRFGTHIRLPSIFTKDDQLGLGLALKLPVSIDASQEKVSEQFVQTLDPVKLGGGTVKMPMKISGGLSYRPNNLLILAAEGLYEGWSDYENDFEDLSQTGAAYTDRYKMGMGVQYFPYLSGSDKFLSNFKYRLGASYDTGHLEIDSKNISTLMFSFGLGIRSPKSGSSIDMSFEYGIRGTNSMNLIKEQIWGIKLSVNLAEIMFYRPKLK